ncbi:chaperonin 10-like protein [Neohortaea acidophila]|uniref:Chaperonin 10-like protein n=1 Tax=Neohortaea acidophila TaxID=245834 RepID=A0A6A6Q821_9PEZI|nr:chaperonin 10-like protein [Neohortaea acidophila]KAF2488199.1 chaperonin 10-like protein [Neohortaea acidophila]
MTHQAAWSDGKGRNVEVRTVTTPTPGPGELLIKVEVIAFSPIESKMQRFETHPVKYPYVSGLSFAGIVESMGTGVDKFAPGDRVTTLRPESTLEDARWGGFQQFAIAAPESTAKLPIGVSLEDGAATIMNLASISSALSLHADLRRPSLAEPAPPIDEKVLIYGGSSSSGGLAICYAKAAGYKVITTSSPRNRSHVGSLKPDHIIDHTQPHAEIVSEIASNGPYKCIFDAIGLPPVTSIMVEYLKGIGGCHYLAFIPPLPGTIPIPANITREFDSFGWTLEKNADFKKWFYEELLPRGLASGVIKPTPTRWLEGGLGGVQEALDLMGDGKVSGQKLVLNPWS